MKDIWKMFCFLALFCIRQVEMLFVISASKVVILLTQPLPSFTRPQPSPERIPLPSHEVSSTLDILLGSNRSELRLSAHEFHVTMFSQTSIHVSEAI